MQNLKIINATPNNIEVARNSLIHVTFNEQLKATSITPGNFFLSEIGKNMCIPISLALINYGKTVIVQTNTPLKSYADYVLRILSKEENEVKPLQGISGGYLYNTHTTYFSTNADLNYEVPSVYDSGEFTSLWTTNLVEDAIRLIVKEQTGQEVAKFSVCCEGHNPSGIMVGHPDKGSVYLR